MRVDIWERLADFGGSRGGGASTSAGPGGTLCAQMCLCVSERDGEKERDGYIERGRYKENGQQIFMRYKQTNIY